MIQPADAGVIVHGTDSDAVHDAAYDMLLSYACSGCSSISAEEVRRHIFANTYPNFLSIKKADGKNEIPVDDTRTIIEFLSKKQYIDGRTVVLVEDADCMSRNAANALLKILEEPPENSAIILTTTRLFAMLPTVRSRCLKKVVRADCAMSSFSDPVEYVRSKLKQVDGAIIDATVAFLTAGCKNVIGFAKQNADHMIDLLDVLSAYCSFMCFKTCDADIANATLRLHRFTSIASKTSPDKQAAIVAACGILMCYNHGSSIADS